MKRLELWKPKRYRKSLLTKEQKSAALLSKIQLVLQSEDVQRFPWLVDKLKEKSAQLIKEKT